VNFIETPYNFGRVIRTLLIILFGRNAPITSGCNILDFFLAASSISSLEILIYADGGCGSSTDVYFFLCGYPLMQV
jgi:hypothetical protein